MSPEEILGILEDQLMIDVSGPDDDLIESGELDSLNFVELLLAVEQQCGQQIPVQDLDLDEMRTARAISETFSALMNGAGDGTP